MTIARTAIGVIFLMGACAVFSNPAAAQAPRIPRVVGADLETRQVGEGGLAEAVKAIASRRGGAAWIGYSAPVIEGRNRMCCFDSIDSLDDNPACCSRCRLEDKQSSGSFSIDDKDRTVYLERSGYFVVLLRVSSGRVGKIRAFSDDCELDPGRLPFYWLDGVRAADSLAYLADYVTGREDDDNKGDEKLTDGALNAIALHGTPEADRLLEIFVARGRPSTVREKASFWIGVSRGRAGYEILRKLIPGEPDDEMRKKVVFALSQNSAPESTDAIISVARNDREPEVRGEAIFWLAQKAGEKATRVISDAIENDPETEVKKKAVFALSQLPADEGVPLLIGLARKNRNPAVRKEAIFWLGQSGDPRALDFIEQILKG